MLVLGVDFEATGVDVETDRILEIGAVLWCTERRAPIEMYGHIVDPSDGEGVELSEENVKVHGIDASIVMAYGHSPLESFNRLRGSMLECEYICAHNGNGYDKPLLENELKRHGIEMPSTPWIDTLVDLPWEIPPKSMNLTFLAAEAGFLNPFSHRAVTDVLSMLRVMDQFDFQEILAYRAEPTLIIRALVDYDNKDKAKEKKFRWQELNGEVFNKCWVRTLKKKELPQFQKECDFEIVTIKEI